MLSGTQITAARPADASPGPPLSARRQCRSCSACLWCRPIVRRRAGPGGSTSSATSTSSRPSPSLWSAPLTCKCGAASADKPLPVRPPSRRMRFVSSGMRAFFPRPVSRPRLGSCSVLKRVSFPLSLHSVMFKTHVCFEFIIMCVFFQSVAGCLIALVFVFI